MDRFIFGFNKEKVYRYILGIGEHLHWRTAWLNGSKRNVRRGNRYGSKRKWRLSLKEQIRYAYFKVKRADSE